MTAVPHVFYTEVIGKAYDIDGAYGAQCWDGYAKYSQWLGYPIFHCTSSGYVKDIWTLRQISGILRYFDEITDTSKFQDGDVVIFKPEGATPLSHIGIFRKDNGNGTFVLLGQNQGGQNGAFNQINISYETVYGALRPKVYENLLTPESGVKITQETGTAHFLVDGVNVRDGSPTGPIVAQYNKGDKVNYWGKYVGNGHRYVVYTSYTGKTRFVAVSGSEEYGKDKWAECY